MQTEGHSDPASPVPPPPADPGPVTGLARRWSQGDADAFDQLVDLVYDDLRRIAHHHLRLGARNRSVSTTELVHEAYLKLSRVEGGVWENRAQFFAFCSKAMRRILIDFARRHQTAKRGAGAASVPLSDAEPLVDPEAARILEVEEALLELERRDGRMARIVECRFFAGLTVSETAEALGTSPRTVEREWTRARAYLRLSLESGGRRVESSSS